MKTVTIMASVLKIFKKKMKHTLKHRKNLLLLNIQIVQIHPLF
jgi:hypothetical protein